MANRSHIYTCDEVPGGKGFHARGLSEYGWDIPLAHKLMVGTNPRIVRSAIWEHDIGILADRAGAFERTIAFFDKLGSGELPDRGEFDEELAQMKEFLATTPPSKFILLEAGEILDLQDGELPDLVAALRAEITELVERAMRAVAGQEEDWLNELRAEWAEKARPGYWSDVLYYSFSNDASAGQDDDEDDDEGDDESEAPPAADKPSAKSAANKPSATKPAATKAPAKPAAKKSAAKKPAAKKPVAKKGGAKKAAPKKAAPKKSAKKAAAKKPATARKTPKPVNKAAKPAKK